MKKLLSLCFLMLICCQMTAQNRLFVRVYDLEGNKINKGFIIAVNDTLLRLEKGKGFIDLPVKTIGIIKTKRSVGNNILIGTLIGTTIAGTLGAATADPDAWILGYTPAEGFVIGTIIGAPAGALLGIVTTAFKNSKTFTIDGDLEKWKAFLVYLSEKTSGEKK